MVNILLEQFLGQTSTWLFEELSKYIKPVHKVAVIAFSFRDSRVKNLTDWKALYGTGQSMYYHDIVESFAQYGIPEEHIAFLNYFSDTKETAREKIESADILYFLGGLPDRMYERLKEFDLLDAVSAHQGIAMGYSAGAVIQLEEYHLSPDKDYPCFAYYPGIPYLKDFYIEVHYEDTEVQNECIRKVLQEKKKTVYALHPTDAMIVDHGNVKLFGDVKIFQPER